MDRVLEVWVSGVVLQSESTSAAGTARLSDGRVVHIATANDRSHKATFDGVSESTIYQAIYQAAVQTRSTSPLRLMRWAHLRAVPIAGWHDIEALARRARVLATALEKKSHGIGSVLVAGSEKGLMGQEQFKEYVHGLVFHIARLARILSCPPSPAPCIHLSVLARFFITLSGVAEKSGVAAKDYVKRLEADVGANSPWTGYYPGKIYRDCGNGSYDIDFGSIDDGVSDIESVKAELIRVVGGAASSAEGSVVLAVGSAVEAKRGKDARDGAVAGANESTCNETDHEKDYIRR